MAVAAHEIQGSQEWLEYRRTRGGASEVAALFECSPFMPKNAFELYQVKTGEREVFVNDAMRHGTRNEPAARAKLEDILGESLEPQVLEDSVNKRIVASLDGQTIDGKTIVEIKCPPKGKASKAWKEVEDNGKPGYHYYLQIQQQLLCSGAEYCLFAVYDAADDEVITTQVNADPAIQDEIRTKWTAFFEALDAGAPPEHERNDTAWKLAAQAYLDARSRSSRARPATKAAVSALAATGSRAVSITSPPSPKTSTSRPSEKKVAGRPRSLRKRRPTDGSVR
jgi:putative phage-type endonuclease